MALRQPSPGWRKATRKLQKQPVRTIKAAEAADEVRRLFGKNLIEMRLGVGLSQEGTAERAGLHRTEVALIEAGERLPRLDTIVKLAGAVEIEPCGLLLGMAIQLDPPKRGSK
jgi:DNA-binding XRE family transcriptional regulator